MKSSTFTLIHHHITIKPKVIEAHEEFLQTLLKRALLDDESRELLMQLRAIYDRILEFQGIQSR